MYTVLISHTRATRPVEHILLDYFALIIFGIKYKIQCCSLCSFLQSPVMSLDLKILLIILSCVRPYVSSSTLMWWFWWNSVFRILHYMNMKSNKTSILSKMLILNRNFCRFSRLGNAKLYSTHRQTPTEQMDVNVSYPCLANFTAWMLLARTTVSYLNSCKSTSVIDCIRPYTVRLRYYGCKIF